MKPENTVFEKTYNDYIAQIDRIDLHQTGRTLGLELSDGELIIPLLGDKFTVSGKGIRDEAGEQPRFDYCLILIKYILLCPKVLPFSNEWAAFRDFKNSGPLEKYFRNDVEMAIVRCFSGRLPLLKKVVGMIGSHTPGIDLNYDFAAELLLLPRLPAIITFNDEDEEFSAACSVVFKGDADSFLDAESLAILANVFALKLKMLAMP